MSFDKLKKNIVKSIQANLGWYPPGENPIKQNIALKFGRSAYFDFVIPGQGMVVLTFTVDHQGKFVFGVEVTKTDDEGHSKTRQAYYGPILEEPMTEVMTDIERQKMDQLRLDSGRSDEITGIDDLPAFEPEEEEENDL